jgi:predicted CXXCH cytochrome family protein
MKCGYLVVGLLFALLANSKALALQLIYPLDGNYVTKSNYLIVKGGSEPELTGLTIEINDVKSDLIDLSSAEYRAAFGDMLVVEPLFDPGENRIVIEGFLNGSTMALVTATVYYHDRYDQPPPTSFEREVFHLPAREKPCVGCHNMSPKVDDLSSPDPDRNACASCHMRMLDQAHVHGPAGVYECTYCHQIDSTPNKYQARPGDAALCTECHDDKLDEYQQEKFVHGPVEAGLCLICHDPHASGQPAQLLVPAYDLCVSCHAKVPKGGHVGSSASGKSHPLRGVENLGDMKGELSCASCHNPHSGASSDLFRWGVESRMSLCSKCHQK